MGVNGAGGIRRVRARARGPERRWGGGAAPETPALIPLPEPSLPSFLPFLPQIDAIHAKVLGAPPPRTPGASSAALAAHTSAASLAAASGGSTTSLLSASVADEGDGGEGDGGEGASPRAARFVRAGGLGLVLAALRACLDAARPGGAFSFEAGGGKGAPPLLNPLSGLPWRRGVRQAASLLAAAVSAPGGWRGASMEERAEAVCLPVDLVRAMVGAAEAEAGRRGGEGGLPVASTSTSLPPPASSPLAPASISSEADDDLLEGVPELVGLLSALAARDGSAARMMASHGGLGALAGGAGVSGRGGAAPGTRAASAVLIATLLAALPPPPGSTAAAWAPVSPRLGGGRRGGGGGAPQDFMEEGESGGRGPSGGGGGGGGGRVRGPTPSSLPLFEDGEDEGDAGAGMPDSPTSPAAAAWPPPPGAGAVAASLLAALAARAVAGPEDGLPDGGAAAALGALAALARGPPAAAGAAVAATDAPVPAAGGVTGNRVLELVASSAPAGSDLAAAAGECGSALAAARAALAARSAVATATATPSSSQPTTPRAGTAGGVVGGVAALGEQLLASLGGWFGSPT